MLFRSFEYTNSVLRNNQIVDNLNFSKLMDQDPIPDQYSKKYDQIIDVLDELRFIGTFDFKTAKLTPIILEGRLSSVIIDDPGHGYIISPNITISGTGTGAELSCTIDTIGRITSVEVIKSGKDYDTYSTLLSVRGYTVLINSDVNANGNWSLHEWDSDRKIWKRVKTQTYNVTRYWKYVDWYLSPVNAESGIKHEVEFTKDLNGLNALVGEIVKIKNVSSN